MKAIVTTDDNNVFVLDYDTLDLQHCKAMRVHATLVDKPAVVPGQPLVVAIAQGVEVCNLGVVRDVKYVGD